MITSIHSFEPKKKNSMTKVATTAAIGAGLGAGSAYWLQKRAIKKEAAKQENAQNAKGLKKWITKGWAKLKGWTVAIKNKCKDSLDVVAKEGKISKKGIAKSAGIGALVLPAVIYVKSKLSSKKDN